MRVNRLSINLDQAVKPATVSRLYPTRTDSNDWGYVEVADSLLPDLVLSGGGDSNGRISRCRLSMPRWAGRPWGT